MKFEIDEYLDKKLRETGCDPDFISFLVDYLLGESEEIELMPPEFSTDMSFRRRVKRAFKKAGEPDSWMRSILKKPGRKAFPPLARKNKYGNFLVGEPKRGRPKNRNFWALIYCLKTYVKKWGLITKIIYSITDENEKIFFKWEEDHLRSEWSRQKEEFRYLDAEGIVNHLHNQYDNEIINNKDKCDTRNL